MICVGGGAGAAHAPGPGDVVDDDVTARDAERGGPQTGLAALAAPELGELALRYDDRGVGGRGEASRGWSRGQA